jgi:dGTPase
LRRLAGVTQVISADEGHVFHNRLTHTLEVAQVARRLADVCRQQPEVAASLGDVDPNVVEAAALAHDLGHPPFGHVGEEELQSLIDNEDSFEGNAQSFRILTRLACRYEDTAGLDLTRATLNASLKYPWFRDSGSRDKSRKWGAYRSETSVFEWVRQLGPAAETKCVEAELMDLADDIAYAVHDVEDFYRARLIPLEVLRASDKEVNGLIDETFARWEALGKRIKYSKSDLSQTLERLVRMTPFIQPYSGTRHERATLRSFTSALIANYVRNVRLLSPEATGAKVHIDTTLDMEITILKELTWHYVILNPKMVAREFGQRRVIRTLFESLRESATTERPTLSTRPYLLPIPYREELKKELDLCGTEPEKEQARTRIAIDYIASMNDLQALKLYHRVSGISLGSMLDSLAV